MLYAVSALPRNLNLKKMGKNKTRNFKSKADYEKWLAYGHMHRVFEETPGVLHIEIRGKSHKVNHKR